MLQISTHAHFVLSICFALMAFICYHSLCLKFHKLFFERLITNNRTSKEIFQALKRRYRAQWYLFLLQEGTKNHAFVKVVQNRKKYIPAYSVNILNRFISEQSGT